MRTINKEWDRLGCVSANFISPVQLLVGLLTNELCVVQKPMSQKESETVASRVCNWIMSFGIIKSKLCVY